LSKWQERVPKLAGALRERTAELDALKAKLAEQPVATAVFQDAASGIKARDSLIAELEAKLKSQSSRHQDAQGQLHSRDVEIAELKEELGEWRSKWQSATENLDAQADSLAHKDADLLTAREELEMLRNFNRDLDGKLKASELELTALQETSKSLETRNEKLFETTEMANRQIESLGDSLNQLRQQTKDNATELGARAQQLTELEAQNVERDNKLASRDQDIEFLHAHIESKQTEIAEVQTQLAEQGEVGRLLQTAEEKLAMRSGEAEDLQNQLSGLNQQLTRQIAV
jgi:chromosome segregation ATPase